MTSHVGFIGVGNMGSQMAARLLSAGNNLTVCDHNPEHVSKLQTLGADVAANPRELADKVEVVFASLPSLKASKEVVFGSNGIIGGKAIKVYVEMSTLGTETIDSISEHVLNSGIAFIDSPVSTPAGGLSNAAEGGLTLMVSGPEGAFNQIRSYLGAIADNVFYLGTKPGFGQLAKIINNHIGTAGKIAAFEGVGLGIKAGMDPYALLNVINASTGRNATTMDKFPAEILPRKFGQRATLDITFKDMEQFRREASKYDMPLWIAPYLPKLFEEAAADGYMNRSSYQVFEYVEKRAGIVKPINDN